MNPRISVAAARTLTVRHDVDLRPLHTFGCAATAERFATLDDTQQASAAARWLREHPTALVLGAGSNLLLATERVPAVLQVAVTGRRVISEHEDAVCIEAAAGENWHELVLWSLAQGLGGLENLALIPGSVGASPVQNIGAYGVELEQRIVSVDAVDVQTGEWHTLQHAQCGFSYRDSRFRHEPGRWLILALRLRLSRQAPLRLDYGDIRTRLQMHGVTHPAARDVADAVIAIRRERLPDPARLGNAGSFFRNPVVPVGQARALADRHPDMPQWPADNDRCKLAAGWLIEQCGFKGERRGDAGVHVAHALVLVNHGQASGAQLLALAADIMRAVKQRFDVSLVPEPVIVPSAALPSSAPENPA